MGKLSKYWKKQKKKQESNGPQERVHKLKVPSTFGEFKEIEVRDGSAKVTQIIERMSTGKSAGRLIKSEDY